MTDEEWAAIERPYRLAIKAYTGMLLTLAQAAEKYELSAQYLRRIVAAKKLPAVKVNARLWLVEDADVERYAAARLGRPRADAVRQANAEQETR